MSRKWQTVTDMYNSKARDRKKRGGSLDLKTWAKILKPKKRKAKKYSTKKKTTVRKTQNAEPVQMTFQEYMYVFCGFAIVIVFLWLLTKYGFKNIFISIIAIIGIIFAVIIIQSIRETVSEQKQIKYFESLLPQIDECKEIINNSSDSKAVKENLDKLLTIMDEIIDAPEDLLNKAGMTNRTMQQQKENVLNNYDILIKQAEESNL